MENFYNILGVKETSSQDEIKKAYRKLAIEHHPDKGGSEETFKKFSFYII
jgi:DnaJ-class molecular chaperone